MESRMYIPVEIAEQIIDTLWNKMDTEWSQAQEARDICYRMIEEHAAKRYRYCKLSDIWYEAIISGQKTIADVPRLMKPRIQAMLEGRDID